MERWMFGDKPDLLVEKVLNGTKTAACALYYDEIPELNERNVIMNS